ncbi:hypothetical protein RDI58_023355 [Solanum bulbocastanum]|uniref:Uncharacterized protein n=1 Tax=Solanum bulbocastanum TaxID=147425 RepID=A0AAN8T9F7_SOLBU
MICGLAFDLYICPPM